MFSLGFSQSQEAEHKQIIANSSEVCKKADGCNMFIAKYSGFMFYFIVGIAHRLVSFLMMPSYNLFCSRNFTEANSSWFVLSSFLLKPERVDPKKA